MDIGAVHCIKVFVPKGDGLVDCDGVYYIRVGNTTQVLSGVKLKSRFLSEKHLQWLDAPTDLSVGDLSPNAISYLIRAGQKAGRIPVEISDTEVDSLLHRFNLIDSDKVTLCGALLFSDEPRSFNGGAYLKIGQFNEDDSLMRDMNIEVPLVQLPESALDKLYDSFIPPVYMYDGGGAARYQKYDYPVEVVRELILNAIMHMDYSQEEPVTVAIYPERLEIFCAGGLPDGMTMDLLKKKHRSILRNRNLASVFYAAGFVESWGQGISKALKGCIANGNPEPEFSEFIGGILVTLYKPVSSKSTLKQRPAIPNNSLDARILEVLENNSDLNTNKISASLGVSTKTVQRHILRLRNLGVLTRVGGRNSGKWIINEDSFDITLTDNRL